MQMHVKALTQTPRFTFSRLVSRSNVLRGMLARTLCVLLRLYDGAQHSHGVIPRKALEGMLVHSLCLPLLAGLFFSPVAHAEALDCLISQGLSEAQQYQFTQKLFDDELHRDALDSASCYLTDFPEGKHHIAVELFRAQSAELTHSSYRLQALKWYDALLKKRLSPSQKEQALLAKGRLHVQLEQFDNALSPLSDFLKIFPDSPNGTEAHYWLGVAHFYHAEQVREQTGGAVADLSYKTAEDHFNKSSTRNLKQKQELYYLRGWIAHFQGKYNLAHQKYWLPYLGLNPDAEHASRIAYQMGMNYHQSKQYLKASIHFSKVLKWQPAGKLYPDALFWRAENHYLHEANSKKSEEITPQALTKMIAEYEAYLALNNPRYHALTLYRLGVLEQQAVNPEQSILRLSAYLKTEQPEYEGDAYFRLGALQEQVGNEDAAIDALEKAQHKKSFQGSSPLRQQLSRLLEKGNHSKKNEALLSLSKSDPSLDAAGQKFFYLKWVNLHFNQQECPRVLEGLQDSPTNLTTQESESLTYMKGGCLLQTQQWEESRTVLASLRGHSEYGDKIFPWLILSHQNLKDWSALSEEYEMAYIRTSPILSSKDYSLWIYALQEQKRWQKLNTVYERWQSDFPEDVAHVVPLGSWGEVSEHLSEPSVAMGHYQKAVTLMDNATSLEVRERIIIRLGNIHQNNKDFAFVVALYEKHLMPYLLDEKSKRDYAFYLGNIYYRELKLPILAQKWLRLVDQGGVTEMELEAVLMLSQIEIEAQNPEPAIVLLKNLEKRKLEDSWKVRLYSLLGTAHIGQKEWKSSLQSFEDVLKQKAPETAFYDNLTAKAEQQVQQIRQHLAQTHLNVLVTKKDWKGVSWHIRSKVSQKEMPLDDYVFAQLKQAESKQSNWQGVLSAYLLLEKHSASRAKTPESLLSRGEAAKNLKQLKEARHWLEQVDTTQNSDIAIRTVFLLTEIDIQEKHTHSAIIRLENLNKHKFTTKSKWYVPLHYQLGFLYYSQKELEKAQSHYAKVTLVNDPSKTEKQQTQSKKYLKKIDEALTYKKLQKAVQAKEWVSVSAIVAKGWETGDLKRDSGVVEALIQAEQQQQKWDRVWAAYAIYAKVNPDKSNTAQTLLNRGYAAEQLKKTDEAQQFYLQALPKIDKDDEQSRWLLITHLGQIYHQNKNYLKEILVYEDNYPFLKNPVYQRKTALLIATLQLQHLKSEKETEKTATTWLDRVDQGGKSEEEIAAILMLAGLDVQAQNHAKAIERLDLLYKRKIPENSPLYLNVHHTLGKLYQNTTQWKHAYRHYSFAANATVSEKDNAAQKESKILAAKMLSLQKQQRFNELLKQKKWRALKALIYKEVARKNLKLTPTVSNALLQAEREQSNSKGILKAYNLIEKHDKARAQTLDALIERGSVAEGIIYYTVAMGHYKQALEKKKGLDLKRRIALSDRLAALYFKKKRYAQVISVYKDLYPRLKTKSSKEQYALIIASYYQTYLKQPTHARSWWKKIDQGGVRDAELQAAYSLAEMDLRAQRDNRALKLLKELAKRKIPPQSQWFLMTHYQLAQQLVEREEWMEAKKHYDLVVAAQVPKEYRSYQKSAQEASTGIEDYLNSLKKK